MFKLIVVLSALVAFVAAGQSGIVDDALLARVAQILSENESSGGGAGAALDGELLARVSQIISQTSSSSSGGGAYSPPSSSYGAPAPAPSDSYGAPAAGPGGRSGGFSLGTPERAERVAEFDLSSNSGGNVRGGY